MVFFTQHFMGNTSFSTSITNKSPKMSDRPIQTLILHRRGIDDTPSTYRLVETTHECQHWNAEMFYLHHHPTTMGSRNLLKIHERKTSDTPSTYRLDENNEATANWYVEEQRLRCNAEMSDEPSDPDPTVEELASEESGTEESVTTASNQKQKSGHSCKSCAAYERGFEKGWEKAWKMAKDMGMVNTLAMES